MNSMAPDPVLGAHVPPSWSDQDIYMRSLAYPRLSAYCHYICILPHSTHRNASLRFIPCFRSRSASPIESYSYLFGAMQHF